MPLYQYVKYQKKRPMRRSVIISFIMMGFGVGILGWVAWPIAAFRFLKAPIFSSIISPLSSNKASAFSAPEVIYAKTNTAVTQDFTNPNIWFPLKPQKKVSSAVTAYTLSIPKLNIRDAFVVIGGDDLNHALVHYGGTALPGENGNAAIFGHSVLPQFFDQKNYKTIFSTLPTLGIGDDIVVTFDRITYDYKVAQMTVTSPDDLSMLEQPNDDSYITLITCVPPGTYWQRLHVRAKLVKI